MPYLGVLGLEFYKTIIIFEIRTLKFVKLQNLGPEMPYWTFLTKSALFGYFRQELKKTIVRFQISTLRFVYLQNFCEKDV